MCTKCEIPTSFTFSCIVWAICPIFKIVNMYREFPEPISNSYYKTEIDRWYILALHRRTLGPFIVA